MKIYVQQLWVISLFVVAVLTGCTTDYPIFDTGQKTGLYSSNKKRGEVDTVKITSKITDDTTRCYYYFTIVGIPVSYDREIAVEILGTNLSKGQYGIGKHVIKANEVEAPVIIEFYNDESLTDSMVYLSFRVVDNEHFNVLHEVTPAFYLVNEVKDQGRPAWWQDPILGPFSLGLYAKIIETFVALEDINPALYVVMGEELGYRLEQEPNGMISPGFPPFIPPIFGYTGEMWGKYKQPMLKYVVVPLYEYYQEYPEDGVKIPEPSLME